MKDKRQPSFSSKLHRGVMFCGRHSLRASIGFSFLAIAVVGVLWGTSFLNKSQSGSAAGTFNPNFPSADGQVSVLKKGSDGSIFLGGQFSFVGKATGPGVPVDITTGVPVANFPRLTGGSGYGAPVVNAAVADGSGGWYIGGSGITSVGPISYTSNLIHIDSTGNLDQAFPKVTPAIVNSLVLQPGNPAVLYVGMTGSNSFSGTSRTAIAAINTSTKALTAWNPAPTGTGTLSVTSMYLDGTTLYVTGDFTAIGGQARPRLAGLNTAINTSNATSWNPGASGGAGTVMVKKNNYLYVGVNNAGGVSLEAYDTTVNNSGYTASSANCNSGVSGLAISGNTLYVAGGFSQCGMAADNRMGIAAFNISGGVIPNSTLAWNPSLVSDMPSDTVVHGYGTSVTVAGGKVYVTGMFDYAGGARRKNVAAFADNAASVVVDSFDPGTSGINGCGGMDNCVGPKVIVPTATQVFLGGGFTMAGGKGRNMLAKILPDGTVDPSWDPNVHKLSWQDTTYMSDILVDGNTVYVGGQFRSIGGQNRTQLAAIDATTGVVTSWNPNITTSVLHDYASGVLAMTKMGSALYVSSQYDTNYSSSGLFAVDTGSGAITSWHPTISGGYNRASSLLNDGAYIYVAGGNQGGAFDTINGTYTGPFAAIDTSGNLAPWSAGLNLGWINGMVKAGQNIYLAGGPFYQNGSYPVIRFNTSTHAVDTTWHPSSQFNYSGLSDISVNETQDELYVSIGGPVNRVNGMDLSGTVNLESGQFDNGSNVVAMVAVGSKLYAGGSFTTLNGVYHPSLTEVNIGPIVVPGAQISTPTYTPANPPVGSPTTFTATFTDSVPVSICALQVGTTIVQPYIFPNAMNGTLTSSYTFATAGTYSVRFLCQDSANFLAYSPIATVTAGNSAPADTTAPISTLTPTGTLGQSGWYTSDVTVGVSATDGVGGSGVKELRYSTNGTTFTTVQGSSTTISLTSEGSTMVSVYAVDNAGNQETPVKTLMVMIDKTAPAAVSVSSLAQYDNTGSVTLNWSAGSDTQSGIKNYKVYKCSVGGAAGSCSPTSGLTSSNTGYADSGLADNTQYYYQVSAVNNAGLESGLSNTVNTTEDSTAPTTPVLDALSLTGFSNTTQGALNWSAASDPNVLASGVNHYNVNRNNSDIATVNHPANTYVDSPLTDGSTYNYKVSATDNASNTGSYSNSQSLTIDTTTPTCSLSILAGVVGSNNWYTTDVAVQIAATDATSGIQKIEYVLDGAPLDTYTGAILVSTTGNHVIKCQATDNAGNVETAGATLAFKIDENAPVTTATVSGGASTSGWYTSPVSVSLAAIDEVDGSGLDKIEYSYDGNTWQSYTAPISILDGSSVMLYYRSFDLAGNVELTKSQVFAVDTIAPITSLILSGNHESGAYADWYSFTAGVTLLATDNTGGSGVVLTEYSIDGGQTFQSYVAPFVLNPGTYDIVIRSKDLAGNVEANQGPYVVKVDGDDDHDGVPNNLDKCAMTPAGEIADSEGCSASQLDADHDGITNTKDQCPTMAGEARFGGCPAAILDDDRLQVEYYKTDKSGLSYNGYACLDEKGKKKKNCKLPLHLGPIGDSRGQVITYAHKKIYRMSDLGVKGYGEIKDQCAAVFDGLYPVGGKTPVNERDMVKFNELMGVPGSGKYLVIARVDILDPQTNTVHTGTTCKDVEVKHFTYKDGDTLHPNHDKDDDDMDDDADNLKRMMRGDAKGAIAKRSLRMFKTVRPDAIQVTGGDKDVYQGSLLSITYPDSVLWEDGLSQFVYPYVFKSDSDWSVNLCNAVPAGYKVAGVYDESGALISSSSCMQTGIANEEKVVFFEVADVGSPKKFSVASDFKISHKGKTTKVKREASTEKVAKERVRREIKQNDVKKSDAQPSPVSKEAPKEKGFLEKVVDFFQGK